MSIYEINHPLRIVAGVLSERPTNGFAQEEFFVFHVRKDGRCEKICIGVFAGTQLNDDGCTIEPKIIGKNQRFKMGP